MPYASALKSVQMAVYTALSNDAILQGRGLTGVFDEAPTDQAYPYISLGTKVQIPYNTFGRSGFEVTLVLDIWTDLDGGDIHFDIVDDINRLFNNQPLAVADYDNAWTQVEWTTTMMDESLSSRHTIARLSTINT